MTRDELLETEREISRVALRALALLAGHETEAEIDGYVEYQRRQVKGSTASRLRDLPTRWAEKVADGLTPTGEEVIAAAVGRRRRRRMELEALIADETNEGEGGGR